MEQLAIGNVSVVVNVVDLEGEAELLLLRGSGRERVEALHELQERNAAVLVLVQHRDYTLHKRIIGQLWDIKEFLGFEGTRFVLV